MVNWTAHANAQLRHIHNYIADDSTFYAKRVTTALVQRTVELDSLPRKGKVVAEPREEAVREILNHWAPYRFPASPFLE
jgi:plasmid stabilization system protein ParE